MLSTVMTQEEAIAAWVAALRETDLGQAVGHLRRDDADDIGAGRFCCLGLACEISAMGHWRGVHVGPRIDAAKGVAVRAPISEYVIPDGEGDEWAHTRRLPELVRMALGLRTESGEFQATEVWLSCLTRTYPETAAQLADNGMYHAGATSLAALNDGGLTFRAIADVIESNPPSLFA